MRASAVTDLVRFTDEQLRLLRDLAAVRGDWVTVPEDRVAALEDVLGRADAVEKFVRERVQSGAARPGLGRAVAADRLGIAILVEKARKAAKP